MTFRKNKYTSLLVKIAISFIASHIVVSLGEERSIFQLMFLKAYYVALVCSAAIAFILLEFIATAYSILDEFLPWGYLNIIRLIVQIATCVGMPLIFAIVLAAFYYDHFNLLISETGYFLYVFKLVVPYVLAINFYYNKEWIAHLWCAVKSENGGVHEPISIEIVNEIGHNISPIDNDVAMVFIKMRTCLAKNARNETILWPYNSIRESFSALPKDRYLLIKRDLIVRADLIKSIKRLPNRNLFLTLNPPFKESLEISKYKKGGICSFGAKHHADWWDNHKKDFR